MVRCSVVDKRDMRTARERYAVKYNRRYSPRNAVWILDDDLVA